MESKKILILSIIVGIIGMFFSYYYLKQKEAELLRGMNLRAVLVASKDIPPKTKLDASLFKIEQVPERYMEPKAVPINTQDDLKKVVGMINLVPFSAGQQIVTSDIVPPSEETGLSVAVPPNMRAIVVKINNIDVIDLVKPHDRVDVLTTFSAKHKTKGNVKVTVTVLQDILVLGVSKNLGEVEEDPYSLKKKKKFKKKENKTLPLMTVSLSVTPDQAQMLALAQIQGDIVLSIRGNNDHGQNNLLPIDSSVFLR
ncbi:MAG: Flp pilus assembly protein CpaB [bacterium]|nr:Flp pilus assembly protein CpaB [bacterium]